MKFGPFIPVSCEGVYVNKRGLSAALVKNIREPGKYHDGQGMGLYLRVSESGAKSWIQRIVFQGKRRELGLGKPPIVTLAEARETAIENKRLAYRGIDPLLEKRRMQKAAITFADAARTVHELNRPTWRNAKHAAQFISTLETYAFPRMGNMAIADVTTADILAALTPIWNSKRETARRVLQRIGKVMKWAIAQGHRLDNPADAVTEALPKDKQVRKRRVALPYADVGGCIQAVQGSGAGVATKLAIELLILTASRSNEIRLARWGQIDWQGEGGPIWHRPASVMKAKVAHSVPLSARAVDVLEQAKALGDWQNPNTLIFQGTHKGKPMSDATLLKLVRNLGFDVDIHGFRTSFKTWAQERTNYANEVSEMALAHTIQNKAEAAYARSDLMQKRRAQLEAWAGYLTEKNENVVRIG